MAWVPSHRISFALQSNAKAVHCQEIVGNTAAFVGKLGKRVSRPATAVSERESEVLRLIASGYSNKEIAARLSLSVKTVEAHKANAMRKLGLTGRIDIVKYAALKGWLDNA